MYVNCGYSVVDVDREEERIKGWDLGNFNIKRFGRVEEIKKGDWDRKIILFKENYSVVLCKLSEENILRIIYLILIR